MALFASTNCKFEALFDELHILSIRVEARDIESSEDQVKVDCRSEYEDSFNPLTTEFCHSHRFNTGSTRFPSSMG